MRINTLEREIWDSLMWTLDAIQSAYLVFAAKIWSSWFILWRIKQHNWYNNALMRCIYLYFLEQFIYAIFCFVFLLQAQNVGLFIFFNIKPKQVISFIFRSHVRSLQGKRHARVFVMLFWLARFSLIIRLYQTLLILLRQIIFN